MSAAVAFIVGVVALMCAGMTGVLIGDDKEKDKRGLVLFLMATSFLLLGCSLWIVA